MTIDNNRFEHNLHQLAIDAIRELSQRPQWVCWRLEERGGKPTKVPYTPTGRLASTTNDATWSSHAECFQAAYMDGRFDGIGFVFTANDDYAGIDLDKCRNPATGDLQPFAKDIIQRLGSFTEVSPSGGGVHIFIKGKIPAGRNRRGPVEMYDQARFFTVTGVAVEGPPEAITSPNGTLDEMWKEYLAPADGVVDQESFDFPLSEHVGPPYDKLEALMENDRRFKLSWQHKRSDFDDQSNSAYDLSILTIAAMAGWSDRELYGLLVAHRQKFGGVDKVLRPDYVARCLRLARSAKGTGIRDDKAAIQAAEIDERSNVEGPLTTICEQLCVQIDQIIRVGRMDAVFYLVLDGARVRIGTSKALLNINTVRTIIFEATGIMPRRLKEPAWDRLMMMIAKAATFEESDESVEAGMLAGMLVDYIGEFKPSNKISDRVPSGMPIKRGQETGINMGHFGWWVDRFAHTKVDQRSVIALLKVKGFKSEAFSARLGENIKTKRYWVGGMGEIRVLAAGDSAADESSL